jgi:hypothetical protein
LLFSYQFFFAYLIYGKNFKSEGLKQQKKHERTVILNGYIALKHGFNDFKNDVFKCGISREPLLPDSNSSRANKQVYLFNLMVQKLKLSEIVLKNIISGRENALKEEQMHI